MKTGAVRYICRGRQSGVSPPGIGDVAEITPDYVIWRDMNIAVRKDADSETRQFAAWLRSDEAAPTFRKYGWVRLASDNVHPVTVYNSDVRLHLTF